MTQKKKTFMAMVVDRSSSMAGVARQAEQNYNETVSQMKENSKEQDIFCSLITFSEQVYEKLWNVPASDLEEMPPGSFTTGGWTAFRDGVGYTIKKLQSLEKEALANGEDIAFLVSIISDGEENASKHITDSELQQLISQCNETGRWTFLYMGCSEENVRSVARKTGIPVSNTAVWSNASGDMADFAFRASQNASREYLKSRSRNGVIRTAQLYCASADAPADFSTPVNDVVLNDSTAGSSLTVDPLKDQGAWVSSSSLAGLPMNGPVSNSINVSNPVRRGTLRSRSFAPAAVANNQFADKPVDWNF